MKNKITAEQLAEIEKARQENKNKHVENRLRALILYTEGKPIAEIMAITGFSRSNIYRLLTIYHKQGLSALVENHYRGNRRNMSFEEEAELLESFRKEAETGHIVDVREIKAAYEEKVGHSIGGSQIYYVLSRHNWRKVLPRSKHPKKASEEVIETSKKLKQESSN